MWSGEVNRPMEERGLRGAPRPALGYLQQRDLYVLDGSAGAHPDHRLPLRVISESPWHLLFARTMFIPADDDEIAVHQPKSVLLHAPGFHADPNRDGTRTATCIALHLSNREILGGGTRYAGEIKKSIFTRDELLAAAARASSRCTAPRTSGPTAGDVALFFGLSGTGKTTLSADPERLLIGDDEHGWSDNGVFNIEGGCYAKVDPPLASRPSREIFDTTRRFGTVLENVLIDANTRAARPRQRRDHREHAGGLPAGVTSRTPR